ncbi:MFS transporter [Glutamicibacter protophormiae]|uniref:MFS transporter n=1 Tax=Glutamicibacter protophormiae TaxID=37930 RepID=UPI0019592910|nr:MFS transporter [Glutamicibacter protophormiae]QRQ78576.1 MFS transporter [Glutamicibacter protophormiae]WPR64643.1 MFS transporter [Glutamicibacter protophormiae]WPR68139.1 MFS transporter [Glutamicibacter protophormiae]
MTQAGSTRTSLLKQPGSVWAIAFACMVSFMGIGLVDPILPAISRALEASQSQTMLLFTSYLFITGIAMFFTSWVSGHLGVKKTLVIGLVLIVAFAALAGASSSVNEILGFRAGWGLGNALFISTALAAIVGAASGGSRQAIVLYEAALGVGMAVGPLVGGVLGNLSWRGPFFGTAVLMGIALVAILAFLKLPSGAPAPAKISIAASFKALRNPALLALSLTAVFYNFGFFILLAYTPFPLEAAAHAAGLDFGATELGLVFFGWGLALAITSVLVAPPATRKFGLRPVLFAMLGLLAALLGSMALFHEQLTTLVILVIVAGLVLGVMNTALTEAVMEATDLPRNVASSTYSGVRFLGGAVAPAVAGPLAAALGAAAPYWLGAGAVAMSILVFALAGRRLSHIGAVHESAQEVAQDVLLGEAQ